MSDDFLPVRNQRFIGEVLQQGVVGRFEVDELHAIRIDFGDLGRLAIRRLAHADVLDACARIDAHLMLVRLHQQGKAERDALVVRREHAGRLDQRPRDAEVDDEHGHSRHVAVAQLRRNVHLHTHRRAQAGALDGVGKAQVHIIEGAAKDAQDAARKRTHGDAGKHADGQLVALVEHDGRTVFHGDLDDQVLVFHVADQGREMLDGFDGAMRDELDASPHLQIHRLEFEVLELVFRGGLVACHAMLISKLSNRSMHDFLMKKHLYQ